MILSPQPQMMPGTAPPQITDDMIAEAQLIADACTWEEVSGVLRSDDRRNYSIDVETTATTYEDDLEEKQARTEYVTAITQIMQFWGPAMQANPSIVPFVKELIMFAMSAFNIGRTMEEALEDAFEQIKNTPPQQQADPRAEAEKAKVQALMAKAKMDMEAKTADLQMKQQAHAADMQARQQQTAIDLGAKQQSAEIDKQVALLELQLKIEEMQLEREKLAMEREKMAMQLSAAREQQELKRDAMMQQQAQQSAT